MNKSAAEKIQVFLNLTFQSIGSALKILIRSKLNIKFPKANEDTCIIMGNGPSMKEVVHQYSEQLLNKKIFAVNYFANSKLFELVKPNYYLIVGPEFWREGVREKNITQRKILFDNFVKKTNWKLKVFLPIEAFSSKFLQQYLNINSNIDFVAFNTTPVEGFTKFSHFLIRRNLGMPRPHNVIIPTLIVALNLGFKNIYLVGVEHSWLPTLKVNSDNEVLHLNKHFYDPEDLKDHKMFLLGIRPRRLHEVLHKFMLAFKGYFIIRDYATTKNAHIINTTEGSYIDAFQRSHIDTIL
jgi:hypothetical protein